jgi:hypothetical protein
MEFVIETARQKPGFFCRKKRLNGEGKWA